MLSFTYAESMLSVIMLSSEYHIHSLYAAECQLCRVSRMLRVTYAVCHYSVVMLSVIVPSVTYD